MTATSSPYRTPETPLQTRERALEQELASTRSMLHALADEEVRIGRRVRMKEAPPSDLAAVRDTTLTHLANEQRLMHELEAVRAEIAARGERRVVGADAPEMELDRFSVALAFVAFFVGLFVIVVMRFCPADAAHAAPEGTSVGWGGPLDRGMAWLYVEGPDGLGFEIDGRAYRAPNAVQVWAFDAHDVRFEGGATVHVRRIPCTTTVVRWNAAGREASIERFYDSSTCF